jgi:hypothetical protein
VGGQRRLVDRCVVHAPTALDRVNLDAEGAFERGHVAHGADHEAVRESVRDPESARLEMLGDGGLVRLRRPMERVELRLREEAMIRGRRGILDGGEKRFEALAVAKCEPDDYPMPIGRIRPAVISRRGE